MRRNHDGVGRHGFRRFSGKSLTKPIGILVSTRDAWAEIETLQLPINQLNSRRGVTFGDLAQHYAEHELVDYTETYPPEGAHDSSILRTRAS